MLGGRRLGTARALANARAAELRGELAQAAALYAEAGKLDEAARVMVLRGDAETDPAARLRHYVQAVETAPAGSAAWTHARRKRGHHVVAMSADAPMTETTRQDLLQAARELEELGDAEAASEASVAYRRAGDVEGEARALARAGDVEKLDALLLEQQGKDREAHARRAAHDQVAMLLATGRRREAVELARASSDAVLRERVAGVQSRRVGAEIVPVELRGRPLRIVLGEEVVVGRVATIAIASTAVSRRHVAVARRGADLVVRDLGSRNGTTLRGLALAGEARVGEGIEVRLGDEVPMVVRPSEELGGAATIELAGERYLAPLGRVTLGIGAWALERGSDGWAELVTSDSPPAFAEAMQLGPRVTLLAGDAIAAERSGAVVLRVLDRP
ncbi:MAG TPA: FHA domain-containing protein [Polyangiaceae bacterium]